MLRIQGGKRLLPLLATPTTTTSLWLCLVLSVTLFCLQIRSSSAAPASDNDDKKLKFGLVNGGSPFFEPVLQGWKHRCRRLGVECIFTLPGSDDNFTNCEEHRQHVVEKWIAEEGINGVAMKPCSNEFMNEFVPKWKALGVPVVTFDSDTPNSTRVRYVGTNQEFLGRTMARLLRQLRPNGGTYAMVARKAGRDDAFIEEIERYNNRDDRAHWHEISQNYTGTDLPRCQKCLPEGGFMGVMERAAVHNPTAMIFFKQSPMKYDNYMEFIDAHRHRGITYIGVDGADYQLEYLSQRYVDALVGQMPHEFGTDAAQALFDYYANDGNLETDVVFTNIVSYNVIPVELPDLDVENNLLEDIVWVGYVCFGIVVFAVLVCIFWTIRNRRKVVVRAAQPFFLYMIAFGVLVLSGSLIPLSMDSLDPPSKRWGVGVCMSIPWMAFVGFTITFSALLSKTWRVNQLFRAKKTDVRITLEARDVLGPFLFLLLSNILVLVLWTTLDPLTYIRQEHEGTDYWNRVISTYGSCRSDNAVAYLAPLSILNFAAVAIACWQASEARHIQSEFSEATYIGQAVVSLFQGFITGIPVVVVVRDQPRAYYLIMTFMIFLLAMLLLCLIFIPKIWMQRQYSKMTPEEQRSQLLYQSHNDRSGETGFQKGYAQSSSRSALKSSRYSAGNVVYVPKERPPAQEVSLASEPDRPGAVISFLSSPPVSDFSKIMQDISSASFQEASVEFGQNIVLPPKPNPLYKDSEVEVSTDKPSGLEGMNKASVKTVSTAEDTASNTGSAIHASIQDCDENSGDNLGIIEVDDPPIGQAKGSTTRIEPLYKDTTVLESAELVVET